MPIRLKVDNAVVDFTGVADGGLRGVL